MKKIYLTLFLSVVLSLFSSSVFSQNPACANFSGVFISDSLEQNLAEYYICSGSNIYLKSINTPSGSTFQWKKNGVDISGATSRIYNVTSEGLYSLTLTQGACTATSSGIIVRQYIAGVHYYQITSNNISQACTGDTIRLSTAKGFGITYQWKKNNVNISGANDSTYKAIATGNYTLTTTQGTCTFNSSGIPLNFGNSANPQITTNKTTICEGRTTTLKGINVNATHTLQWFQDGVAISSANKDSLVVSQTGYYYLQTTKGACTGNSNGMNISITNLNLPAPQIQQNIANAFETCGNNVIKLQVKDYTDGTLTWLKDGNVIAGQTNTELIARESGNYAVRYSGNELCFSQSAVIPVKITNVATLSFDGNDFTVGSGRPATINYTFTGAAPMLLNVNNTYDWYVLNPIGNNVIHNPTVTTTFLATTFANACGVGTFSNPATITVGTCSPSTQITVVNSYNNSVCIGGSKTISVGNNGSSYQWQKDGVDINGATSNNLTITNFNYSDIGNYSLKVSGTCGTIIEGNIRMNANYGDVVFAKLDYPAYTNSDILLTAFSGSSFGNASNAYRWMGPNVFTSTEQNPVIPNGTSLNSGTYTVTATNAGGCVNYALLTVTVTTAPITLGNLGTTSFCPNGILSIPFITTLAVGTLYKVYLSDANGNFRNQTEIGNGMVSPIEITFPQYLQVGTKYRIRIVSTSPSATSTLSGYLSTDGQVLTISVKNLLGREIYYGQSLCQGSALTGIISSNQLGVSYEWKKNGITQSTNPSFRMTQTGNYIASVSKTGCSNYTRSVNISVVQTVNYYSYRVGDKFQCAGTSVIIRNTYFSDSATYQWRRDDNILLGEIKDTLIANITGNYKATITDKCPVAYTASSIANSIVVFSNVIDNTTISSYNGTSPVVICGDATYAGFVNNILNENPLATYSFQWKKNGVNIQDETGPYLNAVWEEGTYSLALSQGNCTTVSNGINVIRKDTVKLKLFVKEGFSNEICQGMTTYLDYNYLQGFSNITLYKDGVATNQNISYNYITETGKYVIDGSSSGCIINPSDTVKITVGDRVTYRIHTFRPLICQGGYAQLLVLNSSPNSNFQWFKGSQPIVAATNSYFTPQQAGFYKCRVTSGSCTGFSDSTEIKVISQLPKPILAETLGNDIGICANNFLRFGFNENKPNNLTLFDSLIVKRNGIIISQQESYSLIVTQPGTYTIIGKQRTCLSEESDPVQIKIGEPITANITGSTSIYSGQKANLNLNFTGGNAWFYQTSDVTTGQTTSQSPTLKTVSPSSTQTYSIASVASNCGVGTVTGNATVTVLPCPTDKTISIQSGNWNIPTTWTCGQIPTSTLDAIIEQGHVVNLPNGYQGNTKKLDLRGGITQGVGAEVKVGY
ncbi:hypothetical protein VB796_16900 [Arcicella sp. LKC2W]|uniref:immunoglobulin domain-containing protein n=1 Tax=Arcicella sp. LKC2W TaxID=2984198 RepID=UPI002B20115A|nr:hypothetical protein [Arcicella sp. LKC2W]MEA5460739.1 hypothetical protein [Arcicella sp. LKC2W]